MSDAERFAKEYDFTVNNVFVYRNLDEINKILENGTGVLYLGFPECPWCRGYIPYLNEVAMNEHLDKIYYFNILNDRKNNTSGYKKTVELLNDYLKYEIDTENLSVEEIKDYLGKNKLSFYGGNLSVFKNFNLIDDGVAFRRCVDSNQNVGYLYYNIYFLDV